MVKTTIRPEWLNSPLITTLREVDHGHKLTEEITPMPGQKIKQQPTNKKVGLWLNRNKAVIVSMANNIEARSIITANMGNFVLYSTIIPGDGSPEEVRDRHFWKHLGEYYDKIMACIRDASEIQIFGPEDAKFELQKRLESEGLAGHIISVEDAGPWSDVQIATRIRKRFPIRSQFDIF